MAGTRHCVIQHAGWRQSGRAVGRNGEPALGFAGQGSRPKAANTDAICTVRGAENYVIPSSDGYGISDCMHAGMDCGRVIADSWCESHGHAHVLAFGTVEDVTGAIQASTAPDVAKGDPGDVVIRCGD